MRAGVYAGPGKVSIESRPVPVPGPNEVLVRVRACGICGSDVNALRAAVPEMAPGTILGHEATGVVETLGAGVTAYAGGERVVVEPLLTCGQCRYCTSGRLAICRSLRILGVHADGAFAAYVAVPAHRLYRIPESLDFRLASLTEPVSVAVHGLRVGGFQPGMRILVLGAGMIGLAAVAAARAWGAGEIFLTARYPHQVELGRACGATRVLSEQDSTAEALETLGRKAPITMVVDTIGHAETIEAAGAAIEPGGTVAELGLPFGPLPVAALPLLHKEARLQWANCYYQRESGQCDFEESLRLFQRNIPLWSAMLTGCVPLEELGRGFEMAGDRKAGNVKVTVLVD
jgi:L-iditol 2-dehydrogenase